MISILLYSLLLTAASMTWLMMNPLTMALTILSMAMTTALLFALSLSSWMAFLIFLIYIGGMMVMFAYFVATSPNMSMNMSTPFMFALSTMFLSTTIIFSSIPLPQNNQPSSTLNTFYSTELLPTIMLLAIILLLTMVIAVKLVSLNKGPLRPFNYV